MPKCKYDIIYNGDFTEDSFFKLGVKTYARALSFSLFLLKHEIVQSFLRKGDLKIFDQHDLYDLTNYPERGIRKITK